jgi:hypothetical protein
MRSSARLIAVLVILTAALSVVAGAGAGGAQGASSTTDPCSPAFSLFEVGNWPPACWRPYSDSSPFNRPIPANPALHPRSAEIVRRLVGFGLPTPERTGIADTGEDYSKPAYFAKGTDPVAALRSSGSSPINGHRIHVPQGARPAGGSDHHMTIVESGWEYDLYRAQAPSGGQLRYESGRRIRVDGSGLQSGATAARFGNLAGRIRAAELEAGEINHALVMVVRCTSGRYVWPAAKTDSRCSNPTDAPPMGARFQLDMSDAQIDALSVPSWKKTILRAAAHYGAYVGDSTSSPWSLASFESGTTYTSFGVADPMVAFARRVGIKPTGGGVYVFDIAHGVDWQRRLRVIDPSVTRGGPRAKSGAPRLWGVSIKPRRLRARTTVRFRLSGPADVTFSFVRVARGSGKRCRSHRGRRCRVLRYVGSFSAHGRSGLNRRRFRGRLRGRRLQGGAYRVTLVAADAGARSAPRRVRLRVAPR